MAVVMDKAALEAFLVSEFPQVSDDYSIERVEEMSTAYADANRGAIRLSSAFVPLIRIAILTGFTIILVLGGFRALDGTLAVGTYSVLVFIVQRLLWPLTRLGETFDLYQRGLASIRRILDLLDSLLFGVGRLDPATYAGVAALLCLAAATACLAPAVRAARLDPMVAIREE